MLFEIPTEITDYLAELDAFIDREIKPIEARDDNIRFFDHRRENARTDWDNDGHPRADWWALLAEMRQVADKAGHYRFAIPEEFGGTSNATQRTRASSVVAPANRSTSPKQVVLTRSAVALAKKFGLTPEQYAREMTKLEA